MARKTMWAVAGALLAFAPVASALQYDLTVSNARVYASESITSDVVIGYRGDAPQASVLITMIQTEIDGIGRNDTIDLTFTFKDARLGRNITASALEPEIGANITGCDSVRVRNAEGDRGSASATFTIEASGGDCSASAASFFRFTFTIPPLTGLASNKPVSVSVTTDTPGGSGWLGLDEAGLTVVDVCGADMADDDCSQVSATGVLSARTEASGNPELSFINYRAGLTFIGTSGGSSSINLAAGRTGFTWPFQAYMGTATVGITNAGDCTMRDAPYGASTSACTLQADGRPFSLGRAGDARGDLHVTVTGDFRSGDVVFLDLDGNHRPGSGEYLDLQNDGSMQESFSLDRVAGNANASEGEAGDLNREEGVGCPSAAAAARDLPFPCEATKNLIYIPNGSVPLRPGEYRSSFSVTTQSTSVADKPAQPSSGAHSTTYTLVEDDQVAYAIPPVRAGDSGMVRVKCEVATHCKLYLECDDQDGMPYFAEVETPVPGRSTRVLTAEDLSTELGLMEGDWENGRMSCSIYSTREISVQQLTRSSTGVLVNNTYVADD